MNLKERIAEIEKTANQLAQTAKVRQVNSSEFFHYREGFLDGERLAAMKSVEIIKKLEDIVSLQEEYLVSVGSYLNREDYGTSKNLVSEALEKTNNLMNK